MNIKKFVPLMLAVALMMPAMAQKKLSKSAADDGMKSGSIIFTVDQKKSAETQHAEGRMMPPPARTTGQPKMAKSATVNLSASVPQAKAPQKQNPMEGEEFVYSFEGPLCYGMVPGMFYEFDRNLQQVRQGVRLDEPVYHAATYKLCMTKRFDCKAMEEVARLQREGKDQEAEKLLEKFYKRTEETKEICGMKATRYEMTFAKGELWVAEEVRLGTWFAPFWGINHPVLEFDVPFGEDCAEVKMHLSAQKFIADEILVKKEQFNKSEEFGYDEMCDMMRMLADKLGK